VLAGPQQHSPLLDFPKAGKTPRLVEPERPLADVPEQEESVLLSPHQPSKFSLPRSDLPGGRFLGCPGRIRACKCEIDLYFSEVAEARLAAGRGYVCECILFMEGNVPAQRTDSCV